MVSPKAVASVLKLRSQAPMVVDFSVENDPNRAVLVGHRLIGGFGKVHDRQPPEAEPHSAIRRDPKALPIRSPVPERVAHAEEDCLLNKGGWIPGEPAYDSAHRFKSWARG